MNDQHTSLVIKFILLIPTSVTKIKMKINKESLRTTNVSTRTPKQTFKSNEIHTPQITDDVQHNSNHLNLTGRKSEKTVVRAATLNGCECSQALLARPGKSRLKMK
jgi:hypothetical protein